MKEIIKVAICFLSGIGLGAMAKHGVQILTPENAGKITKASTKIAGFFLASYAGRVVAKEIDQLDKDFTKAKEMITNMATGVANEINTEEEEDNAD